MSLHQKDLQKLSLPPLKKMVLPLLGAQLKWSQRSPLSILQEGHSVCQFLNEGAETEEKIRSIFTCHLFGVHLKIPGF